MSERRVVITGMSAITPLADQLDEFLAALLAGRSAVSPLVGPGFEGIYARLAATLYDYDIQAALLAMTGALPDEVQGRARHLSRRAPWSTQLSILAALQAFRDASWWASPTAATRLATVVSGHNLNSRYICAQNREFEDEPDFIDGWMSLHALDTDHAGSVAEVVGAQGPIYTVGGACASGNVALRCAVDEIRHHGVDAAMVVGAVFDFSAVDLHAMALMGAITHTSFNDAPTHASRPYDQAREGFVPAHGAGALMVEERTHALARGAHIYAEVLGVESGSDGNHLPQPSAQGQARVMRRLLDQCGVAPEQVDFVSAHATSTPLGDITELRAIKDVFGDHAYRLRLNAPKSMLGHTCWSAPIIETVAAVLQLNAGRFHGSVNIDALDPEVDLDVCQHGPVDLDARILMKNAFGFGGINSISLLALPGRD